MSYSSRIANSSRNGHAIFAILLTALIAMALIKDGWKILAFLPWWVIIVTTLYLALCSFESPWNTFFGCIAKVYAPFNILIYWLAIYPTHNPWTNRLDTFLVLMVHVVVPILMILEIFRPRNTHSAFFRQRNPDFVIIDSFWINTLFYLIYVGFYLLILPSYRDPIYVNVGFTKDESRDALLAFMGWIIILCINLVVAILTWHWRQTETKTRSENFSNGMNDHKQNRVYVMNNV